MSYGDIRSAIRVHWRAGQRVPLSNGHGGQSVASRLSQRRLFLLSSLLFSGFSFCDLAYHALAQRLNKDPLQVVQQLPV